MKRSDTAGTKRAEKGITAAPAKKGAARALASGIVPVASYDKDVDAFVLASGHYMGMAEIRTKDLLTADEETIIFDDMCFDKLYHIYSDDLKLVAFNFPADTAVQQGYLHRLMDKTKNPVYQDILETKILEQRIIEAKITDRQYALLYYGEDKERLKTNYLAIRSCLTRGAVPLLKQMDAQKKVQLLFRMFNMNTAITENYREGLSACAAGKQETSGTQAESLLSRMKKRLGQGTGEGAVPPDPHFVSAVGPQCGITFSHERYISLGDGYAACLYVYQYPKNVGKFWLSDLTAADDTICVIDIASQDVSVIKKNINKSMEEQASRYSSAKDNAGRIDAQNRFSELEAMYNEIAMMDDTMKNIVSRLYVYAPTLAGLEERITALSKGLEGDNYRCGISLNETKADFEALVMPSSHQQKSLYRKRGQPLLSSALAAGNPFNYTTLSDPYGTYYGMSTNGGGVINLDLFRVTDMRMSYNSVLVGKMGSGKSTTLKKMVTERAIRGDTIRVFDPTGEFTGLADYLGGRVVSLDGQSGNIINALQILKAGDNTRISYNQHFSKVSTIYRYLQPEASYQEVLMMEQVLRKLYQLKGFTAEDGTPLPDACDRPPERYPIWSDYLKLVRLYQEKFADSGNSAEYLHLKAIELVIDNLVESYGNMFDGFTVVKDLHAEQIICFDISELKSMKDQIFDAQLFSALSLCWDNCVASGARMKQAYDRGEIEMKDVKRFLITIDEAHRIINANKLTGVEQISLFAREARKYFGGIALASQSIRDFVPDNASSSGIDQITRLFELSTYKFVMQQDASASAKFRQVFAGQFSEHEIAQIPVLEKGQTILAISGDQNLTFKVEVSDEELALFAGGA